jgi:glyoxylase-like metal-dependent hydrolase (beta-lactamase superfamily II)
MEQQPDRWQVGKVAVTRIVDLEIADLPTEVIFGALSPPRVAAVDWLHPHYATAEGNLKMSFHAYVIESGNKRIIVDTCVGNHKARSAPFFNQLATPFLERLEAAGFTVGSIDYVLCTHMHIDHVGWNTRWTGERWTPTFPNARYLFGRDEWAYWRQEVNTGTGPYQADMKAVVEDSVQPIIDAGVYDLVETTHRITGEVSLFPTPGHTPGHVSVMVRSDREEAVIAGDVMHHPVQLFDPAIESNFDSSPAEATATRLAFIAGHANRDVLVLGTHFARPSGGRIVTDAAGWRFSQSPESSAKEKGKTSKATRG